jgi:HAMP domain-containing protein
MGLKTKFNLVLLVAFLVGLSLAAGFSYAVVSDNARREVLQEAAIMMGQASVISNFTDHEIAPLLAEQQKLRFAPQGIPFFVAQSNFRELQKQFPDYTYREPATNPTNPEDRPTDWQADIIDVFAHDPKLTEFVSQRPAATGPVLLVSRPIRVTDKSCLECHSVPSAAPKAMVDLYGSANGFGWKVGDLVGAQIVSVPMRLAFDRANHIFMVFLAGLASVFAVTAVLLNVMLQYMVVRRVQRISETANEVSLGAMSAPEIAVRGNDEISLLAESFNRMRRSLENAMKLLTE